MLVQSIKANFRAKPPLTGYYKEYPRNAFLQFCSCFIYKWGSLCQGRPWNWDLELLRDRSHIYFLIFIISFFEVTYV